VARVAYVDLVLTVTTAGTIFGTALTAGAKQVSHLPLPSLVLQPEPVVVNDPAYFMLIDMGQRGIAIFTSRWVPTAPPATPNLVLCDGFDTGMVTVHGGAFFETTAARSWTLATSIAPSPPPEAIIPVGSKIYIGYEGDQLLATKSVETLATTSVSKLAVTTAGNDLTLTAMIQFDNTKSETQIMSAIEKCKLAVQEYLSSVTLSG
jgi:hypothetical protein